MSASVTATYSPTGLALWHLCPRQFWFTHVAEAPRDAVPGALATTLGVAGHAGMKRVCAEPGAAASQVRDAMLASFEADVHARQRRGTSFDPEQVSRALDRLETEYLELVVRFGQSERVRGIDWTHLETRLAWTDERGRPFAATLDASGVVRERLDDFGRHRGQPVTLERGTRVVVDWKFGQDPDHSHVGLSLNLQLAFCGLGAERLFPGERVRPFMAALREALPTSIPKDRSGRRIPRTIAELNPAYVEAFGLGYPVTPELAEGMARTRRRFKRDGQPIPKRLRRPNPAYLEAALRPRGAVFHEARTHWDVIRPTVARTVDEIERATASGDPDAFPAHGPQTRACARCPFRSRCVPDAATP